MDLNERFALYCNASSRIFLDFMKVRGVTDYDLLMDKERRLLEDFDAQLRLLYDVPVGFEG